MTTQTVIAIVVVAVLLVVLGALAAQAMRRRQSQRLRQEFGPEYDRTVEDAGTRRDAERELAARKQEHDQLELRPLTPAARERYTTSWAQVQSRFVDAPTLALHEGDTLVTQLMAERGYPADGFDQQARMLSVENAEVLDRYRSAHEVELAARSQQAGTEQVRHALIDLRTVFEQLVTESAGAPGGGRDGD